jgi:lipid-A-disaccharide synthase-like uncharacterized protein
MELIGYIGSAFLAINAVPELIRTINDGRCHIGWPMLVLWLLGEIFTTVYAISLGNIPLIMNYVFNLFIVIVMLWYKLRNIFIDDKYIEKDDLIITKL